MNLLDLSLPTAAENVALDEALLLAAEAGTGGEVLRLWESPALAVVVGAGGSVAHDVNVPACEADGVAVVRRASGGGTVLVGPGCLCFAVVLRADRGPGMDLVTASARWVMGRVLEALRPVVPGAAVRAVSDLAVGGRKFSGSAQQRKRRHFLHHSTLIGRDFPLDLVPKYLHPPERQPAYRLNRPHREFVTAVPADAAELRRRLLAEWRPEGVYEPVPLDAVRELVVTKYARDEWNRRR